MTSAYLPQLAASEFDGWVRNLRAVQAHNVPRHGGPECVASESVTVSREDAVDLFLKLHQKYGEYRKHLLDRLKHDFSLSAALWEQAKAAE